MEKDGASYRFYREREDKSNETLGVVTLYSPKLKVVITSQWMDMRTESGDTFATLTFPSWVKVRKIGE